MTAATDPTLACQLATVPIDRCNTDQGSYFSPVKLTKLWKLTQERKRQDFANAWHAGQDVCFALPMIDLGDFLLDLLGDGFDLGLERFE